MDTTTARELGTEALERLGSYDAGRVMAGLPPVRALLCASPREAAALRVLRAHPEVLPCCEVCEEGCECDGVAGDPVCEHYACWGRAAADHRASCPGAPREALRLAVWTAERVERQGA